MGAGQGDSPNGSTPATHSEAAWSSEKEIATEGQGTPTSQTYGTAADPEKASGGKDEFIVDQVPAVTGQAPGTAMGTELTKLDSKVVKIEEKADDPLEHLPEHEREILKRQLDSPDVKVSYFTLYRYATKVDLTIIAISAICAIASGAMLPLMTVSKLHLNLEL